MFEKLRNIQRNDPRAQEVKRADIKRMALTMWIFLCFFSFLMAALLWGLFLGQYAIIFIISGIIFAALATFNLYRNSGVFVVAAIAETEQALSRHHQLVLSGKATKDTAAYAKKVVELDLSPEINDYAALIYNAYHGDPDSINELYERSNTRPI